MRAADTWGLALLLCVVLGLTACAPEPKYVPVEIKSVAPPLPPECKSSVPSDLPPVPQIEGKTADAARVNAHWAKHDLEQRRAYRRVRDGYRVCQTYAQGVSR